MTESGVSPGATIGAQQGFAVGLEPLFQKLKPGPGQAPEQVYADQRRRLYGAMVDLLGRQEWNDVKVRSLVRAAGVSTATFYRHFVDADDCLAATYDAVTSTVVGRATASQRQQADWRDSLRAAVDRLMRDLAKEPLAARLVLFGIFSGGAGSRKRITQGVSELERLIASCFAGAPRSVPAPRHLVAGMTAGILRVARTTTLTGRTDELPDTVAALGDWMASLPAVELLSLLAPSLGDGKAESPRREPRPFPDQTRPAASAELVGNDRDRLLRAAIKLAELDGFANLTVSRVRAEAGVSRRRFEDCFQSIDECFLEAIDGVVTEAAARARGWSEGDGDWRHRTCRFILALCAQAARDRTTARLAFLGIFATGHTGLRLREVLLSRAAAELEETVPEAIRVSPIAAEASVAAIWHIAQSDIATGRIRGLPAIAPFFSYMVLAPYLGASEAAAVVQAELGGLDRADR
jgi:AcrR family transcriptional regulator